MINYKPIKDTIDVSGLTKMIIAMLVYHHGVLKSIVMDQSLLFTSKFWFLLYYFLGIKKQLFTAFFSQINSQIERQNSIIKAYLRAFIN